MDKKLTLSLDKGVIESAKQYAKLHNISLSKLIESYLAALTRKPKDSIEVTALVESLSGIVELPPDFDEKETYSDYLMKKYK